MEFLNLAKKRFSVRNYQDKKVEPEKLATILEAGQVAPTAANKQPQKILVVQDQENLKKLQKAGNFYNPPLALIVCADKNEVWIRPQDGHHMRDVDSSIITTHMMLAATDLGLGSLWLTWYDPKIISREFNIPDNYVPVNILIIGYSATEAPSLDRHPTARKPLNETVFYESFAS